MKAILSKNRKTFFFMEYKDMYLHFLILILLCSWTRAIKRKRPAFLFPLVPLSFVLTYQYDLGYGTLLQRMKGKSLINQRLYFWFIWLKYPLLIIPWHMKILIRPSPWAPHDQHFCPLTHCGMPEPAHNQLTRTNCQIFRNFISWLLNIIIIKS